MQMMLKMYMAMAMPKMAPTMGPAEEFGEESSRRERLRGGGGGGGTMLKMSRWIQINISLLILSNTAQPNQQSCRYAAVRRTQIICQGGRST